MTNQFPFSGDVLQSINPWTFFVRQMGQIGFININLARTPAPEMEQSILEEVGSYGRQIGRIADALDVLLGTLDKAKLDEPQLQAVMAFREQLQQVRAIKAMGKASPEPDLSKPPATFVPAAVGNP